MSDTPGCNGPPANIPPSPEKRARTDGDDPFPPPNTPPGMLAFALKDKKDLFKVARGPLVGDYLSNAPATVSIKSAGYGAFALIYVNKFGMDEEAYDWPILRAIQNYGKHTQQAPDKFFLDHFDLLVALPRRVSKEDNSPVWIYSEKQDSKFKEKVFLIRLKAHNNDEIKRVLTLFARFLSNNNAPTEVKTPCDETDYFKQSLDNFVPDDAIMRFLIDFWNRPVNRFFFSRNPRIVSEAFFSAPYPSIAKTTLGYPNSSIPSGNNEEQNNDEYSNMSLETSPETAQNQRAIGDLST